MKTAQHVKIDVLLESDLDDILKIFCFPWTSYEATQAKWVEYMSEQKAGNRTVCLVKSNGAIVGYGSLLRQSKYARFRDSLTPEIHDVWIAEEYRGVGLGKTLISRLEHLAQTENHETIGIGVGLYKDYGKAQRLYIQLGYVPDGEGVTYKYGAAVPGSSYPLDDDLVLWFRKNLPALSPLEGSYYLERQVERVPCDEHVLFDGICNDAANKKGMERITPFSIYIKDANQTVLGGATGVTYYGCLYVDQLWVEESVRSRGFGKTIMKEAEKIARERKCTFATVNTMDWEALTFYQKLGYQIEFTREGYEKASKMHMLRKEL